jgi:hypothetical protein
VAGKAAHQLGQRDRRPHRASRVDGAQLAGVRRHGDAAASVDLRQQSCRDRLGEHGRETGRGRKCQQVTQWKRRESGRTTSAGADSRRGLAVVVDMSSMVTDPD